MLIFCKKNADTGKFKGILTLKGVFYETIYVCVLTYQISSFSIILTSFRQGVIHPAAKRTPKKPSQIRVKVIVLRIKSCFQILIFDKGQLKWFQAKKRKFQEKISKGLEEVVHSSSTDKMFCEFQNITRKMSL